jgi:hypothetical protein
VLSDDHPIARALIAAGLYRPDGVTRPVGLPELPRAAAGDPAAAQYGLKALEYEADIVAASTEGTRNDALNRAAFKLGSLVTAGHLDGQLVIDTLIAAARVSGLPVSEINRVVYRAAREGGETPRVVQLEPRETIAPAFSLAVPPGNALSLIQGQNSAPAVDNDDQLPPQPAGGVPSTVDTDIGALYPVLDWPTVFEQTPDDVDWLAYPVFERGRLYSLYSPAKAGKSLFAIDVCAALAAGTPVLGSPRRDPVTVLYVDLENSPADLVERLNDLGFTAPQLERLRYLSFPSLPPLDTARGGLHLAAITQHYAAELVVIDTVSRTIAGKENDSDTFHALYRYAMAPLKAMGVTVIRLDHAGKDEEKGMRGSSAKVSDVDTAWKLTRTGEGRLKLERTASRNSHSPEFVVLDQQSNPLRHVVMADQADDKVTSLVHTLTRLGVPQDWGRARARKLLVEQGIRVGDHVLSEAIRARKTTLDESV